MSNVQPAGLVISRRVVVVAAAAAVAGVVVVVVVVVACADIPMLKISHSTTPKDQTSLFSVGGWSSSTSGADHLAGTRV